MCMYTYVYACTYVQGVFFFSDPVNSKSWTALSFFAVLGVRKWLWRACHGRFCGVEPDIRWPDIIAGAGYPVVAGCRMSGRMSEF